MSFEASQNPQKSPGRSTVAPARSGIVWLASYPKSGNTWTRAFLHNLVHVTSGQAQVQQINELNQFSMGSAGRSLYEEILGFVPTDEDRDRIAAARARVQELIADSVDGLAFVKTHKGLSSTAAIRRSTFPSRRALSTLSATRSTLRFPMRTTLPSRSITRSIL